jgi:hypothetical protein
MEFSAETQFSMEKNVREIDPWSCKKIGGKTPCKKSADLLPKQGNLPQRNNFSLHFRKWGGDKLKMYPFFKHAPSSFLAQGISMVCPIFLNNLLM